MCDSRLTGFLGTVRVLPPHLKPAHASAVVKPRNCGRRGTPREPPRTGGGSRASRSLAPASPAPRAGGGADPGRASDTPHTRPSQGHQAPPVQAGISTCYRARRGKIQELNQPETASPRSRRPRGPAPRPRLLLCSLLSCSCECVTHPCFSPRAGQASTASGYPPAHPPPGSRRRRRHRRAAAQR